MRLRNGADEIPEQVSAVMSLLQPMTPAKRKTVLAKAQSGEGFVRGHRMTPRMANIIICAVLPDGSLRSPYAEGK